jgi:hypothetical protein
MSFVVPFPRRVRLLLGGNRQARRVLARLATVADNPLQEFG